MKVKIIRIFRSKKLDRIVNKGEVIEETEDWITAIEQEGFGERIIEADVPKPKRGRPRKKILKIHGERIETASVEHE